ncbi:hypothetical protein CEE69_12355 [Rhodopirellula bahusiensis]|uniref:Uncharacterized protein n=1 Tax=Rhodopirellula bahusiensis TaxID=2014065 RepID=A0A2G1W846_9BACT|nr:hypothetical protein CEE69_12355 [Rhodopirellula bahusiensis]
MQKHQGRDAGNASIAPPTNSTILLATAKESTHGQNASAAARRNRWFAVTSQSRLCPGIMPHRSTSLKGFGNPERAN